MVIREIAKVLRLDPKSRLKRKIKSPEDAKIVIETLKEEIEKRKRTVEFMKQNVKIVKAGNNTKRFQLVTPGGKVVASVSCSHLKQGLWEGHDLYVGSYYFSKVEYRQLGLAKFLLGALREYLTKKNATALLFNAKPGLAEFYEKLGAVKDQSRSEVVAFGLVPMKFVLSPGIEVGGK
ncbi:MAG: GNAT family N-acetyltransferase [Candidatus ainarchaeum sp.]|nr:GNAT family N-acetyltransferase [Candidatus ainarchaeum sp.]